MSQTVTPLLQRIKIVLVETSHPGNIGAAARAMKTMGLSSLRLVNPLYFPHPEALTRASGADDVLTATEVFPSLAAAISDCQWVWGTSARERSLRWELADSRAMGERLIAQISPAHARAEQVAIVFGRERTGLTNDELAYCQYHVKIPSNPEYNSLNLAAAVQILCYELRMAAMASAPQSAMPVDRDVVTQAEMERFYQHLEQVLIRTQFLDPARPGRLMLRLRRLFQRAAPDTREMNILRGILRAMGDFE